MKRTKGPTSSFGLWWDYSNAGVEKFSGCDSVGVDSFDARAFSFNEGRVAVPKGVWESDENQMDGSCSQMKYCRRFSPRERLLSKA